MTDYPQMSDQDAQAMMDAQMRAVNRMYRKRAMAAAKRAAARARADKFAR